MMNNNILYQKEALKISWYEFAPGNGFRYEFGISKPPFFMTGCDLSYLMIILPHAYYPFRRDDLCALTEETVSSYYCDKLNLDHQDAVQILMFIKNIVLKGDF